VAQEWVYVQGVALIVVVVVVVEVVVAVAVVRVLEAFGAAARVVVRR
jgi:hypothetical protein